MAGKTVRSRILFDYTKPELHGYLYKQGGVHKAFKKRYFVLYPGYLVYYTDETKYRIDVAKGSLQVMGRLSSTIRLSASTGVLTRVLVLFVEPVARCAYKRRRMPSC